MPELREFSSKSTHYVPERHEYPCMTRDPLHRHTTSNTATNTDLNPSPSHATLNYDSHNELSPHRHLEEGRIQFVRDQERFDGMFFDSTPELNQIHGAHVQHDLSLHSTPADDQTFEEPPMPYGLTGTMFNSGFPLTDLETRDREGNMVFGMSPYRDYDAMPLHFYGEHHSAYEDTPPLFPQLNRLFELPERLGIDQAIPTPCVAGSSGLDSDSRLAYGYQMPPGSDSTTISQVYTQGQATQGPSPAELYTPSSIMTVSDGWAFIRHMACTSAVVFRPTVTCTDHRPISKHTWKRPVAELMMVALSIPGAGMSTVLYNEDDGKFDHFESVAPPSKINVRGLLGGHVEITLVECAAYFAALFNDPELLLRLARAGMTSGMIQNLINWIRQLEGESAFNGGRINSALHRAGRALGLGRSIGAAERTGTTCTVDFTAQNWQALGLLRPIDYPLLALEFGVEQPIQGEDAGPLTHLMTWCKARGQYQTLLSEVPALLVTAGISSKIVKPANGDDPDRAAFARLAQTLENDRKHRTRPAEKALG